MFLKRIIKDLIALVKPRPKGVSILMYHSIDNNEVFFTVKSEVFARQMAYLSENKYRVISLTKLMELLKSNKPLPDKTVVLTFDDGFKDFYRNAWPILKKYNFPVIVFLPVSFVGQQINNSASIPLKLMDWTEIRELYKTGLIEFGSHTLSHPKLETLEQGSLETEISQSKKIIEEQLQTPCLFFAAPKGGYDDRSLILIKKTGYTAAFNIKPGFINKEDDLFELKRNSINSKTSFIQFKSKI